MGFQCTPADIPAVLDAFKVDGFNQPVGALLGGTHGVGKTDCTKDPATGSQQVAISVEFRAGMENFAVFCFSRNASKYNDEM